VIQGRAAGPAQAMVVTAADATYGRCLLQLLASLERVDPARSLRVTAYDLGLSTRQLHLIGTRFPRVELRSFDLAALPPFMRIRERALNSNAWKPQLIAAVLAEQSLPVLWLDSATVLLRHPRRLLQHVQVTGLYTPFGGHSSIARWTHPATAAFMGVPVERLTPRMRASGVLGLDPQNARVRELVTRWAAACREPACVTPEGATRRNHNFDQSVLNLLLLEAKARDDLRLTEDELDISSVRPVPELRTRNKVHVHLPMLLDPLLRTYFAAYRALDRRVLSFRRSALCPSVARDMPEFAAW
jgi:hypothetical protein